MKQLDFGEGEVGYRAQGAYDRDLEDLLHADIGKSLQKLKEEKEKEKKKTMRKPTSNPIREQLAESTTTRNDNDTIKVADSTQL